MCLESLSNLKGKNYSERGHTEKEPNRNSRNEKYRHRNLKLNGCIKHQV